MSVEPCQRVVEKHSFDFSRMCVNGKGDYRFSQIVGNEYIRGEQNGVIIRVFFFLYVGLVHATRHAELFLLIIHQPAFKLFVVAVHALL